MHYKLTLSFLGAVIVSLFFFQLFTTLTLYQGNFLTPQFQQVFFSQMLQGISTEAAFYLKPPLDQAGVQLWLEHKEESSSEMAPLTLSPSKGGVQFIGVVDQESRIIAVCGRSIHCLSGNISSPPKLSPEESVMLDHALQGQKAPEKISVIESNQMIFVAVPIPGSQGHVQGALFLRTKVVAPGSIITSKALTSLLTVLSYFLRTLPVAIFMCIPLYYYSHRFSRHLRRLTAAAQRWSQGDFTATVQNNRKDEIGRLTRHLNGMAQQLQNMMEMQQELASSNERNRLARELHDTIKQQVFALNFQIAIARKLHQPEHDQLALHLAEAQNILQDIQKEMTNLIFPMRQAALKNQDLADILAIYLSRWSYQYGIFVRFTADIQGQEKNFALSTRVKETFFRVAQEALSNVARHSKASYVQVILTVGWLYVTLRISDNGESFDYTKQKGSGMGLSSMEERIKAINGHLQITNSLPSGTEVLATYESKEAGPDVAVIPTYKSDK
jgi:NarL family two-component system sensor histidine kinase LiaS